jgi:PPOX class probable F420-dependent enzyme
MKKMTAEECKAFMIEKIRTGKLATVRGDGRPHVVPIWFDLDENTLVFNTGETSVKALNMKRDPRVCICVDEEVPPFAFVQIEGTAEISTDPEAIKYWATRIGGRYMGADKAEAYGERNSAEGELLVRINITKIFGHKDVAGW